MAVSVNVCVGIWMKRQKERLIDLRMDGEMERRTEVGMDRGVEGKLNMWMDGCRQVEELQDISTQLFPQYKSWLLPPHLRVNTKNYTY